MLFTAGVHIADNKIIGMWWNEEELENSMHHFVKHALTNIDHQRLTSMHQSDLFSFVIWLLDANICGILNNMIIYFDIIQICTKICIFI